MSSVQIAILIVSLNCAYAALAGEKQEFSNLEKSLIEQSELVVRENMSAGLVVGDKEVNLLLREVADLLSSGNGYMPRNRLAVSRQLGFNARALANGQIYINSGVFSVITRVDQLAALIAHEQAHIDANHSIERWKALSKTMNRAKLVGALVYDWNLQFARKGVYEFSREHEYEADKLGTEYLRNAGFDVRAMVEIFQIILQQRKSAKESNDVWSTHPVAEERIDRITSMLEDHFELEEDREREQLIDSLQAQFVAVRKGRLLENAELSLRHGFFNRAWSEIAALESYNEAGLSGELELLRGKVFFGLLRKLDIDASAQPPLKRNFRPREVSSLYDFEPDEVERLARHHLESASRELEAPDSALMILGELEMHLGNHRNALEPLLLGRASTTDKKMQLRFDRLLKRAHQTLQNLGRPGFETHKN